MAGIGTENLVSLNTLVFGSLEFLFWYLPVLLLLFYLVPEKWKEAVLFIGSILMYGLGEPVYCFVLLGMTAVNYLFGRSLESGSEEREHHNRKKGVFWISICCNAGLLCYFKMSAAFDTNFLLPLGISFYVFKSISYLADVYLRKVQAEHSFIRFGAYQCLFFQLVSGPIARYETVLSGLKQRKADPVQLEEGVKKIIFGLSAKILIADRLGILWNDVQTIGFESISTPLAWLAMLAFSLQLYFDFAGYSLMATGIGEMFGIPGTTNFEFPYASRSAGEFFRRWHMSLGSWFRDYLYIPMGGNRKGLIRTMVNLLAVWLVTGFWHGTGVNFLLWGLTLGLVIVFEKLGLLSWLQKHRICSHLYVLLLIPMTWMIFTIPDIHEIGVYFSRLFPVVHAGVKINEADFFKELKQFAPTLICGILFCIPAVGKWFEKHRNRLWMTVLLFCLFWICVYHISNAVNNPFMYAAF